MNAQPYLNFDGRTEEALQFYAKAIGAKVDRMLRVKDAPPDVQASGQMPANSQEKVMHCVFRIGGSTLLASDGDCQGKSRFSGVALTLDAPDEASARRWFDALAAGGKVQMPLGKTFFSDCFGMLQDKFGLGWMIVVYKQGTG